MLTVLANDVAERRELTWLRLLSADPVRELSPVPGRSDDGAQGSALVGQPRSAQTRTGVHAEVAVFPGW